MFHSEYFIGMSTNAKFKWRNNFRQISSEKTNKMTNVDIMSCVHFIDRIIWCCHPIRSEFGSKTNINLEKPLNFSVQRKHAEIRWNFSHLFFISNEYCRWFLFAGFSTFLELFKFPIWIVNFFNYDIILRYFHFVFFSSLFCSLCRVIFAHFLYKYCSLLMFICLHVYCRHFPLMFFSSSYPLIYDIHRLTLHADMHDNILS